MDTISSLVIAILPIMGVIIGASLQYVFSKSSESRRHLATLRTQSYIDYLRCVAEIKKIGRNNPKVRKEILAKAADAKTRMSVYGSLTVIEALASFEKAGAVIDSPHAEELFLALCNAIRQESIGKSEKIEFEALKLILFGPEDKL